MSLLSVPEPSSILGTPVQVASKEDAHSESDVEDKKPSEDKISSIVLSEASVKLQHNPYKLPLDADYSKILEEEKQQRKLKFKKMVTNPVHRKIPARNAPLSDIMHTISDTSQIPERPPSPISEIKNDPEFRQALAKGEKLRNMEDLTTFINNKREIFLIQYMIGIKRDEMLRLLERESREEDRLGTSEKWLEEDAVKFGEYLRLNDREAVDAVKRAEMETRIKLDKVSEIKKINILIVSYKSKISKLEDILTEYKLYAKFLTSIAPQEWKKQRARDLVPRETEKKVKATGLPAAAPADKGKKVHAAGSASSLLQITKKGLRTKPKESKHGHFKPEQDADESSIPTSSAALAEMISDLQLSSDLVTYLLEDDEEEKAELYFTEPDQLSEIFKDLEEKTLRLIQKAQDSDETMEEIVESFAKVKSSMRIEADILRRQVQMMEQRVKTENKKGEDFEFIAKMHMYGGEFEGISEDKLLADISKKINEVYTRVLGPNDANLNALQMTASLEFRLEVLLEALESMPFNKIEAATKKRERQRRLMKREAKARDMAYYLTQRKLRTMEKALQVPKTVENRRVMLRSPPQAVKKRAPKVQQLKNKNEEEQIYFFT